MSGIQPIRRQPESAAVGDAVETNTVQALGTEPPFAEFAVDPSSHVTDAPLKLPAPGFINGEFQSLDPNNVTVDFVAQLIRTAILGVLGLGGCIVAWTSFGLGWETWAWLAVAAVVVVTSFVFAFFWPRVDHRHTSFRIDGLGIEIRRGVFWRHQICVPVGRVQHADVAQGPIQRINGVASLVLHTAGTSNASVAIEGLAHQLAIDIRDWIVHQRKNQDAV